MYAAFVKLLNMSAASSILIALVIVVRFFLRKIPKKYICILWAIVAVRLVCPTSISSAVSAYNYIGHHAESSGQVEYIHYNGKSEKPKAEVTITLPVESEKNDGPAANFMTKGIYIPTFLGIWAAGAAALLGYAAISYYRIWVQVRESIRLRSNIFICDYIPSPFILGFIKPKIYLPSHLDRHQQRSVVAHERAHIARLDHLWKPLGYSILCVHWFNPLVWIAYALLCRDIEMACDERVIQAMAPERKQEYAALLLSCSMPKKLISACPVAFGEADVKQRIRGILNYRKPSSWVIAIAVVLCAAIAVSFLTNPQRTSEMNSFQLRVGADNVYTILVTTPKGSGSCQHADNSCYAVGETVFLEPMSELDDWAGVKIVALGQDGEPIWAYSVPENMKNLPLLSDGEWLLYRSYGGNDDIAQNTSLDHEQKQLVTEFPENPNVEDILLEFVNAVRVEWRDYTVIDKVSAGKQMTLGELLFSDTWMEQPIPEGVTGSGFIYRGYRIEAENGNTLVIRYDSDNLCIFNRNGNCIGCYRGSYTGEQMVDMLWKWATSFTGSGVGIESDLTLTQLAPKDMFSILMHPTTVLNIDGMGAVTPENQGEWIDAWKTVLASDKTFSEDADAESYYGVILQYEDTYLKVHRDGKGLSLREMGGSWSCYSAKDSLPLTKLLEPVLEEFQHNPVNPEDMKGIQYASLVLNGMQYSIMRGDPKLQQLEEILTSAKPIGIMSACWFTSLLTVTVENGRSCTISVATDSCGTYLSDGVCYDFPGDNAPLYRLFGVDLAVQTND